MSIHTIGGGVNRNYAAMRRRLPATRRGGGGGEDRHQCSMKKCTSQIEVTPSTINIIGSDAMIIRWVTVCRCSRFSSIEEFSNPR